MPEFAWDNMIAEGPNAIVHDGTIYLIYSGSLVGIDYTTGLVTAPAGQGADLTDAERVDEARLSAAEVRQCTTGDGSSAPATACGRNDEDGNLIYVFHNAEYEHGRYGGRDAQVRRVHWSKEGMPILDMQTAEELDPDYAGVTMEVGFLRCRLSPLNDKRGIYAGSEAGGNGEHVVTMREVAKAAGVSIKTVSNVVNDYEFVSQATRDKVNKAIVELGYTVNVSARNLRRGQTGIIGLAIPDLQMPYFAQLSSLVIEEAKKARSARDRGADAIFARWRVGSAARVPADDDRRPDLQPIGARIRMTSTSWTSTIRWCLSANASSPTRWITSPPRTWKARSGPRQYLLHDRLPAAWPWSARIQGEKVGSAALRYQGLS